MPTLRSVLLVGLGGFLGSVGRYLLGGWAQRLVPLSSFPWGTLAVNVSGCFLIGLLGGWSDGRQAFGTDLKAFLMIGVLGGYTTFSSFAYETLALSRDGEVLRALMNIGAQVALGLAATALGYALGRG